MKGVRSHRFYDWHKACPGVQVVDIGGFAYLYCSDCRCLTNMEAVSVKDESYEDAKLDKAALDVKKGVR